ncbi:unnamed protein product, partial [Didymodactylos carnosus]
WSRFRSSILHFIPSGSSFVHQFYSTDSTFIHCGVGRPGNVE